MENNIKQFHEPNITDISETIKRYQYLILRTGLIASVFGVILVFFVITPKWQASVILQAGQVAGKPVEPVGQVIARIKHPSFQSAIFKQINLSDQSQKKQIKKLFESSLKVTKPKEAELVEVKVNGYSPILAGAVLKKTFSYLQKTHTDMMNPEILRIRGELTNTIKNLVELKSETNSLRRQLESKHEWSTNNAILGSLVLQNKSDQLRILEQKKLEQEEPLNSSVTFTTKMVGDIDVSEEPIFPHKNLFQELLVILLITLVGLLGAVFFAFVHNAATGRDE